MPKPRSPVRLPSRVGFCWLATLLVGWPLLGFAAWELLESSQVRMAPALLVTAAMVLVLELLPVQIKLRHFAGQIVVSGAFVFAMMFIWGPWVAIVVRALGSVCTDLRAGRQWFKVVFNPALYAVIALAASSMLTWHRDTPSPAHPANVLSLSDLPWIVGSWAVWFVVNECLVAGVVPGRFVQIGTQPIEFARDALLNIGVLAMSALVIALATDHWFLVPMLLIPLLLLRWTGQVALDREHDAAHDTLTGVSNRLALRDTLDRAIADAGRRPTRFALMLIDLDGFKTVNDTLGHHAGDSLLVEFADRLRSAARPGDCVARLGGDEFAVLAVDVAADGARAVAARIRQQAARSFTVDGSELDVDFSLGIALYPDHGADTTSLLRHADVAMYRAKGARTGIEIFGTATEVATRTIDSRACRPSPRPART